MPKNSETYAPLLSPREAGEWLGVSHWTIRKLTAELGAIRVGGQLRFRRERIEAYLNAQTLSKEKGSP